MQLVVYGNHLTFTPVVCYSLLQQSGEPLNFHQHIAR